YLIDIAESYDPLLTMKVQLEYNLRNRIKIMAGVSNDTASRYPEHMIEFPMFNFQGSELPMRGFNGPGDEIIELGLDVTPLLSYVESGSPARFFMIVEERDTNFAGYGTIDQVSFIHYGESPEEFVSPLKFAPIENNGCTFLSSTGAVVVDKPVIVTESLPSFQQGQPMETQLEAAGGVPPYQWSLEESYHRGTAGTAYQSFTDHALPFPNPYLFSTPVGLPFSFPFYGELFDTVWINLFGMIQFTPQPLPYPWLSEEMDMLKNIAAISPLFSCNFVLFNQDGVWYRANPDSVLFRWKVSLKGSESLTNLEFMAVLYPDGRIVTCTGPVETGQTHPLVYSGLAKGDGINKEVTAIFDIQNKSGRSTLYDPLLLPGELFLSEAGLLTVAGTNSQRVYDLTVRVTDAQNISSTKTFALGSGLEICQTLSTPSGVFQPQETASLDVKLKNIGSQPITGLTLILRSTGTGILITDSLVQVNQLLPGASVELPGSYRFILTDTEPDGTLCPFSILATSSENTWIKEMYLTVCVPDIMLQNQFIEDGVNRKLDIGETAFLVMNLSNQGSLPAGDLSLHLRCDDPFVEILSENPVPGETLMPEEALTVKYLLHALPTTPLNHQADLILEVTYGEFTVEIPVSLSFGSLPLALITTSESSGSDEIIAHLLDSLQIGYVQYSTIPQDLKSFPMVFLFFGTDKDSYVASTTELNVISDYLEAGGNIYMENYKGWCTGTQGYVLKDLFRYWFLDCSPYTYNTLVGTEGSFTGEMYFRYAGDTTSASFEVVPLPEASSLFENTDQYPKTIVFAYDGDEYKTIGSLAGFSSLCDTTTPSSKAELLDRYLTFFNVMPSGPFAYFHSDVTWICRRGSVRFTDDSYPAITSLNWEFPGGSPATSTEQNPEVTYESQGVYDVILTISDGFYTRTMHKRDFIHVLTCPAVEESPGNSSYCLYPNPATDEVHLRFSGEQSTPVEVQLVDLKGNNIRSWHLGFHPDKREVSFLISGISPGVYILQIRDHQSMTCKKLIIQGN
ncbi:MAG: T9SS type A sorting domain-containing protein, partial [Bacteroidales bacterium]|nr:T9SS type A sorting domain-containing protein [Bacteroidales bacterium]